MPPPIEIVVGLVNGPWLHDNLVDAKRLEYLKRVSERVFIGPQKPTVRLMPLERSALITQYREEASIKCPRSPPPEKVCDVPATAPWFRPDMPQMNSTRRPFCGGPVPARRGRSCTRGEFVHMGNMMMHAGVQNRILRPCTGSFVHPSSPWMKPEFSPNDPVASWKGMRSPHRPRVPRPLGMSR